MSLVVIQKTRQEDTGDRQSCKQSILAAKRCDSMGLEITWFGRNFGIVEWCDCHAVTQLRTPLRIQLKGKTRDHARGTHRITEYTTNHRLRRARLHTGSPQKATDIHLNSCVHSFCGYLVGLRHESSSNFFCAWINFRLHVSGLDC